MGYDVTKNYRPYVILPGSDGKGPILCDTHTDGGGWIVIQVNLLTLLAHLPGRARSNYAS